MPKPLFLNFVAPINPDTAQRLMAVISEEITNGRKDITLLLSSSGGTVLDGIAIYNFIKALPIPITIYNIGQADSMATVVFVAGTKRYSVASSSFFFHGIGFDLTQGLRLDEKMAKDKLWSIQTDQKKMSDIITKHSDIKQDWLNEAFLLNKTMLPDEAKETKLVDDIKELAIPEGADITTFFFGK